MVLKVTPNKELANQAIIAVAFKNEKKKEDLAIIICLIGFTGVMIIGILSTIPQVKNMGLIILGVILLFWLGAAARQSEEKYELYK